MCWRLSSRVVAPMQRKLTAGPRSALSRLLASIEPRPAPAAPTTVWILIDEQHDLSLSLRGHSLTPALERYVEFTAVFRAGNQGAHVERVNWRF